MQWNMDGLFVACADEACDPAHLGGEASFPKLLELSVLGLRPYCSTTGS